MKSIQTQSNLGAEPGLQPRPCPPPPPNCPQDPAEGPLLRPQSEDWGLQVWVTG